MVARFAGAVVRAMLVVLLIATPSLLLPGVSSDSTQIVVLLCLFAAAFTIFEYASDYPSLVEFRDAPPFNRIRYVALFVTVFSLTVICRSKIDPTLTTEAFRVVGLVIANALDFPYSPVRLMVLILPDSADPALVVATRTAAGLSYLISLISLAVFVIALRVNEWPARDGAFNVWVNLPTFDPTTGGDVVERLQRDARFNVALGILLPFLIPVVMSYGFDLFDPLSLAAPQTLIWTMTAWAFLPSSLFMRGIALRRLAAMIAHQRKRTYARLHNDHLAPA